MSMTASPWWAKDRHADRRPFLVQRGRIKQRLRSWFEAEGFTEVEAGLLQVSPGNEAHLHAFATEAVAIDGRRAPLYLHTSPEFAAKKLIAAGETRIVDFARVFRNRERGPLHHPEFTMVEWYRVGEPYEQLMADCAALMRLACETAGATLLTWRGATADPFLEPERVTLAEAFDRHAGIDLLATIAPSGEADRADLAGRTRAAGIRVSEDDTWADIFSKVLVERIEPKLGFGRPAILCEYPVSEAALARPKPADPRVAERFELYACGVELANAFGELTDPTEQRRRFEIEMAEKARVYGERYPIDEELLAALALMPPTSGIALGFERLVMLATGARAIDEVIWTPVPETFSR
ncbi:EF-P lysine aminoacylase EpmA [Phreatobacter stygius]|uniref:EF-P lysine aminoacylase GenX n=1 Tax=Phreatobacter stygius TaxID=1940610 RepID=A0A4D7ATI0_9HYPH|nr:EF-P lysine aminoacylase EpmA [Phreatobacter stygius]QCI64229.1 EF-P lysine aminoacylase GenX [Phreatobacter stygius]